MSQPNTNDEEAQQAPACFGAPSCYATDSKICQACVAYGKCGDEVTHSLVRIKNIINVDDLLHKHNQALSKQRAERLQAEKKVSASSAPDIEKPMRATPKSVERTSKVEKIVFEIDEKTSELIEALPVKARPFAAQLCKSGLVTKIKKEIKDGVNSLESTGPKWLSTALANLIDGGFSHAGLRAVFVEELKWTENTAASHVSLAVKLFTMFEIAIKDGQSIVVNPELLKQTKD